jgi:hypothetical protein
MPVVLSEKKTKNWTSVSAGALVWADVLFEGETHFGDKVRVVATPTSATIEGKGMGVLWNTSKEVETAGEFTERISAIFILMTTLRDKYPEEVAADILTIFHELWGPWYTQFVQSWNVGESDLYEETDGEEE